MAVTLPKIGWVDNSIVFCYAVIHTLPRGQGEKKGIALSEIIRMPLAQWVSKAIADFNAEAARRRRWKKKGGEQEFTIVRELPRADKLVETQLPCGCPTRRRERIVSHPAPYFVRIQAAKIICDRCGKIIHPQGV